jgi:hypothetical protein
MIGFLLKVYSHLECPSNRNVICVTVCNGGYQTFDDNLFARRSVLHYQPNKLLIIRYGAEFCAILIYKNEKQHDSALDNSSQMT